MQASVLVQIVWSYESLAFDLQLRCNFWNGSTTWRGRSSEMWHDFCLWCQSVIFRYKL